MRIIVIGGSAAGLLASLMLARADHDVVLLEQDNLDPAPNVEAAAAVAHRPAAPQVVQPHLVMARCRQVLVDKLPDIYGALLAAGAVEVPLADRMAVCLTDRAVRPGDDRLTSLATRRSTLDWILRRAALAQPGIEHRCGVRVTGVQAQAGVAPHVIGVHTDHGDLPADLIVDASGRRSAVDRWLSELGAQPAQRSAAECGVTYYGRHYRIQKGGHLPGLPGMRSVVAFDEFTAVLFCSDNATVQTALVPLTADPRFRNLATAPVYDAVLRILPTHAPFMGLLEPITPVRQMVAPHNTLRRLVVNGAPVVTGLLSVGDATCTTNPTFGRGLSLAAWGATDLVEVLDEHQDDPSSQSLALDGRIIDHVVPYYRDQAKTDSARLAMLRHTVAGTPLPSTPDGQACVNFPDLGAAAATNPVAFRAFWALMGMLRRPEEIYHDPEVVDAVANIRQLGLTRRVDQPDPAALSDALNT